MIHDARHPFWTPPVHHYVMWRLRRSFRGLWLDGGLPATDEPLILYANHANFWDGFIAHALVHAAGREGYALMEEQNLARHRLLTRLGTMSIRRGDRRSVLETLRHSRAVLRRPRATLLIFPQGKIERPGTALRFERGLEVLAARSGARAVPLAIRYGFFEHEYPDVLLAAGEPHPAEDVAQSAARLERLVARVNAAESPHAFTPLLAGRRSVAEPKLIHSRSTP